MKKVECPDSQAAHALHKQPGTILQQVKSRLKQNPEELAIIQQTSSRRIDQHGIKERCNVVLSAMRSKTICELSRLTSKSRQFIRRWLSRYIEHGVNGLRDRPRSGRPPSLSTDSIEEIKELCFTSPDYIKSLDEFDHARDSISSSDFWTLAGLAAVKKVSVSTMCRFCKKHGIARRPSGSYCFSTDRDYEAKITSVHRALCKVTEENDENIVVLSYDEKPCIQANQHALVPTYGMDIKPGCRYIRHGTTNLLAAFNPRTGKAYIEFSQTKDREKFKSFLEALVENNPELRGKKIKLVLDNLSTHKLEAEWHNAHPEFEFIFTPTTSSWCNPVEAHFSIYSNAVLKGASWNSVDELESASLKWYQEYEKNPIPFNIQFNLENHLSSRRRILEQMKKRFEHIVERCKAGLRLNNSGFCYFYTIGLYLFRLTSEKAPSSKAVKEYKDKLTRMLGF